MKLRLAFLVLALIGAGASTHAGQVSIANATSNPESMYAARRVGAELSERGYSVATGQESGEYQISLVIEPNRLPPEAFAIRPEGKLITIAEGDNRSLLYGALALAETLRNSSAINGIQQGTACRPMEITASGWRAWVDH
jgi:hypothetical protein